MSKYCILSWSLWLALPIAFLMARLVAFTIPIRSISEAADSPIPQVKEFSRIQISAVFRIRSVSLLESSIRILHVANCILGLKTTHPATTGPAKAPLPTSSRPTISSNPFSQRRSHAACNKNIFRLIHCSIYIVVV